MKKKEIERPVNERRFWIAPGLSEPFFGYGPYFVTQSGGLFGAYYDRAGAKRCAWGGMKVVVGVEA